MFRLASALPSFKGGSNGGECPAKTLVVTQQIPPLNVEPPANSFEDMTSIQSIPPWVRELNKSRVTRHSRASSIVSTQTKFTTTTLQEDARSIDINVGGQYFRISRDGSSVTADAPPPYTGPGGAIRLRGDQASDAATIDRRSDLDEDEETNVEEPEDGSVTPRSISVTLDTNHGIRANILDPTEFEMPSPIGDNRLNRRSSTATLVQRTEEHDPDAVSGTRSSFEPGRDILSTPSRFFPGTRAASQDVTSTLQYPMPHSSLLRRTNGVRLPRLMTSSDIPRATHRPQCFQDFSSPGRPIQVRSADAVLGDVRTDCEPRSPDYIGRNARGAFPLPIRACTTQMMTSRNRDLIVSQASRSEEGETHEANNTPPAMNDENDISLHYARMMRTLDAAHRQALHIKDRQISELRENLNEKDIVLRQQLRAKDFIIDDLKKRLSNLEENMEARLERAVYVVEDLWESRWKDRDFHLRERMRRIEEDAQRTIDRLQLRQP